MSWPRLVCAGLLAWGGPAAAQDADDIGFGADRVENADDVLGPAEESSADDVGFGAGADSVDFAGEHDSSPAPVAAERPPSIKVGATLRLQTAYRLASQDLAKARQLVDVRLEARQDLGSDASVGLYAAGRSEVDFYMLANRDEIDRASFDVYAWQVRPTEIYLALDWSVLALRIGEQIVNLGQGEVLSVLDVVNPRDLREPLLTEPEDLRLPVLLSRAGLTFDRTRIEVIAVHEPFFGLVAPPLGEWNPMRKLILEDPTLGPALQNKTLYYEHVPPRSLVDLDATQFHARVSWSGPSVDLALVASDLLDSFGLPTLPPARDFEYDTIAFPVTHPRYALFGHSGALTLGPCLLRWELAYEHRHPVTLERTDTELTLWTGGRLSALRGMLGLTYAPSPRTSAALEVLQTYLLDSVPTGTALLFPLEATQIALRASQSLLRERLTFSGVLLWIGVSPLNAWGLRIEARYAITDALEVQLGLVWYHSTDHFGAFYGFGANERLFLNLRWNISG